jgi:uncharacterized BrkB/YihY/UPF0761 family membrane protein
MASSPRLSRDTARAVYERVERLAGRVLGQRTIARLLRVYRRYYELGMHHMAGSVTYSAILAIFPFFGLLYALAATVIKHDPTVRAHLNTAIDSVVGLNVDIGASFFSAQAAATTRAVIGTLGFTGVFGAGQLWVEAYRQALRPLWGIDPPVAVWRKYLRRMVYLALLIPSLALLGALALAATRGPYRYLAADGHPVPTWLIVVARLTALLAAVGWAILLCLQSYRRVGGAPASTRVRQAAAIAGTGLAGLIIAGLLLLRHVFAEPLYGISVAILGMLIWVSAGTRLTLSLAVWASTEDPPDGRGKATTNSSAAVPQPDSSEVGRRTPGVSTAGINETGET